MVTYLWLSALEDTSRTEIWKLVSAKPKFGYVTSELTA